MKKKTREELKQEYLKYGTEQSWEEYEKTFFKLEFNQPPK